MIVALLISLSLAPSSSSSTAARGPALSLPFGRAADGTLPGALREEEASPEGPSSFAVDEDGRVWLLDAVHRRVGVYAPAAAGRATLVASVPLPSDTIEDIALSPRGELVALDRLVARTVFLIAPGGTIVERAAVEGAGIDDGGDVTGVLCDDTGVWLEVLRGAQVRVLDKAGAVDAARPTRPGLPLSDGSFVRMRRVHDSAQLLFLDANGVIVRDGAVTFSSLLELSGLVVGGKGDRLWIAGHELVQTDAHGAVERDAIVVVEAAVGPLSVREVGARRVLRASPEFVPLKQLVPTSSGAAHLFVDTTAVGSQRAGIEVTAW